MDNKLKIINYLGKNLIERYTMHNLSKLLHLPYSSFYRTVLRMKDLLLIESIGNSKVLRLNRNNSVTKAHLIVSSDEEKKDFLKKQPIIKKIVNDLDIKDIVVLFGSYAKAKQTEKSDIDFLIINRNGKKSFSFSKYEILYNKKINPIFITNVEFKKMLKSKEENIGKQVLKNHIILNNPEEFWECILNAV